MTNPTVRTARYSARHPWRALIGWILLVALCLAAEGGLQLRPLERIVVQAAPGTGPFDRAEADAAARDVVARMRRLPEALSVADPVADARPPRRL
ncbi:MULTISPECIES: hypothetical protein [Streptomyces]|uniref:Membrane transport protein MMPL domain-containing protein n=1 Tax=Streptomyces venezuelae TaxID=54571 RepID=A0A5P2AJ56_STRVZ|nr:hypothetical protein [Streptomyces venezuelae]QES18182.1 hypothetical protein DEJ46_02940 [Streptomyces venezuelae]